MPREKENLTVWGNHECKKKALRKFRTVVSSCNMDGICFDPDLVVKKFQIMIFLSFIEFSSLVIDIKTYEESKRFKIQKIKFFDQFGGRGGVKKCNDERGGGKSKWRKIILIFQYSKKNSKYFFLKNCPLNLTYKRALQGGGKPNPKLRFIKIHCWQNNLTVYVC